MSELIQIEWIAGGSAVAAACLAGTISFLGAAILSKMNAKAAMEKEKRDYARQDEVSTRVEALRIEAARHAQDTVEAVGTMAGNIDKIERATNSMMAEAKRIALEKAAADAALAHAAGLAEGTAASAECKR